MPLFRRRGGSQDPPAPTLTRSEMIRTLSLGTDTVLRGIVRSKALADVRSDETVVAESPALVVGPDDAPLKPMWLVLTNDRLLLRDSDADATTAIRRYHFVSLSRVEPDEDPEYYDEDDFEDIEPALVAHGRPGARVFLDCVGSNPSMTMTIAEGEFVDALRDAAGS